MFIAIYPPIPHATVPNPASSSSPTPKLKDLFTDTNGTTLAAHVPDIGPGWTVSGGTWTIQSNKCLRGDNTGLTVYMDSVQKNPTGSCTINLGLASDCGFVIRLSDTSNFWLCYVQATAISIYDCIAGVFTQRATAAIVLAPSTNAFLEFSASGNNFTAQLNGSNTINYSSGFNSTATNCGLYSDTTNGQTWDTFLIY